MPIRIREIDNIGILDVDGRLDINSSDVIETVGWMTSTGKVNMIMNFENVDLVDSSGLSVLAIAYKNVVNHKGRLKFTNVPPHVMELFKVAKLDAVFDVYPDEESAFNSFHEEEIDHTTLRRRFPRLDIHLSVKFVLSSDRKHPKAYKGQVINISAAGLYVYTPVTFPVNSPLHMVFSLPNKQAVLTAEGKVSWLSDKEIQSHFSPGMGIAFSHLTPAKERMIVDFIDKNISHRTEPV